MVPGHENVGRVIGLGNDIVEFVDVTEAHLAYGFA